MGAPGALAPGQRPRSDYECQLREHIAHPDGQRRGKAGAVMDYLW